VKEDIKGVGHAAQVHVLHASQVTPPTAAKSRSKDPQLVTEPRSLQDPKRSQKIWDDAYDSLEKDEEKLVQDYRMILAKFLVEKKLEDLRAERNVDISASADSTLEANAKSLKAKISVKLKDSNAQNGTHTSATGNGDVPTWRESLEAEIIDELKDRNNRQVHMEILVKSGMDKFDRASKITKAVGDFSRAILSLQPIVGSVIQNVPHAAPAALPWAGVCFGLQVSNKSFVACSPPSSDLSDFIESCKCSRIQPQGYRICCF
jgi:hypothetical protein